MDFANMTPDTFIKIGAGLVAYGLHLGALYAMRREISEMKVIMAENLATKESVNILRAASERERDQLWAAVAQLKETNVGH